MTRDEAIDYLLDPIGKREKHDEAIRMAIEALEEVIERKRGEWLESDFGWRCSICENTSVMWQRAYNYCPNCGADMRG